MYVSSCFTRNSDVITVGMQIASCGDVSVHIMMV